MRHKWKTKKMYKLYVCERCKTQHRYVKGSRGGVAEEWSFDNGKTWMISRLTPACVVVTI